MATIKNDELNIVRAIPFDEYFEPMAIEDYQKEQRIRLAEEISKAIFYILLMFETAKALKLSLDAEQMRESMAQRYLDAIEGLDYDINDPYYEEHIRETSDSLVTTTMDNLNEPWFTSQDRADYIAEDEANSIANHADLEEAKSQGYTSKTWKTMKDERVRHTHRAVDETTVGIDEPFIVGHYKMLAPRDDSLGAGLEEIIRCRCSLSFLKNNTFIEYNSLKDDELPVTIEHEDIIIHKSVGAMLYNYDVMDLETGEKFHFAEGTRLENVQTFAGKGVRKEYKMAWKYAERHGGREEDWQHTKGIGYIQVSDDEVSRAEVHWSQCEGIGKFDFFIKKWLDD